MLRICFAALLAALCQGIRSQELSVKSFGLLDNDNTALAAPVLDNQKKQCALVKIDAGSLRGLTFSRPSQYKQATYDESQRLYMVYIPAGLYKLDISHESYLPFGVDFKTLGNGKKLEGGRTYLLKLNVPETVSAATGCKVLMKVKPLSATVTFNGKKLEGTADGSYELDVEPGSYAYVIEAVDHNATRGTVSVSNGETKTLNKKLNPILHQVNVACSPSDAQVYVDDMLYGQAGTLSLPQGTHTMRIEAHGYLFQEKTVAIDNNTSTLTFSLKKNKNVKEIHAVAVTIHNSSDRIFKNGYEIRGWKDGATVMFMPGKYLLTDDWGGKYKLVVKEGSKPMSVEF